MLLYFYLIKLYLTCQEKFNFALLVSPRSSSHPPLDRQYQRRKIKGKVLHDLVEDVFEDGFQGFFAPPFVNCLQHRHEDYANHFRAHIPYLRASKKLQVREVQGLANRGVPRGTSERDKVKATKQMDF